MYKILIVCRDENIKNEIHKAIEQNAKIKEEENLVRTIAQNSKMDIPHSMIDNEIDYMIQSYSQRLAYQGATLDDYLKHIGSTMEAFREQCHHDAHENVEARLVLQAIIEKEKIEVTDADLDARLEEIAKQYGKSLEDMKKEMDNHTLSHLQNEILTDKVFEFLRQNNKFVAKKTK